MEAKVYATYNKNDIRGNSSSGGIFYELAKAVINTQGVVFGAAYDSSWKVVHSHAETLNGIEKFLGSKYVQSGLGTEYQAVKEYLVHGRTVMFSGTPCQVEGLKAFLGKEYENLITIDFICHGVPSPGVWRAYLETWFSENKIVRINFRDKTEGWERFSLKVDFADGTCYRENLSKDLYMRSFLKNLILRPSCYECQFKKTERKSDITLADYWGIQKVFPEMYDEKGVSLVIIHTEKGINYWNQIKENLKIQETDIEKAISYNKSFTESAIRPIQREKFFENGMSDFKLLDKMTRKTFQQRVIGKTKGILKRLMVQK